ncbi:unnamed protein product [Ranitomeya imitator]|uniref:Integrase catalytic domain-containing protein n=1 Tax=Ranitomeya imitator TaxID=111125 RepID=A0ABN9KU95_9NEOB|nr:unnamed protein product [Ranitomeya imitator]
MYPMVVQWAHGPTHRSMTQMNDLIGECNSGGVDTVPTYHLARPLNLFQRIQIDHIQMRPNGGFEYAIVVVDVFSGWPEAFPVRNQLVKTTAKKLLSEIVCRYGGSRSERE